MVFLSERRQFILQASLALLLAVSPILFQLHIGNLENHKEDNEGLYNDIWRNYNQFQQYNIRRQILENTRDTLRAIYHQTNDTYTLGMIEIYDELKLNASQYALIMLTVAYNLPNKTSINELNVTSMTYSEIEDIHIPVINKALQQKIDGIQQDNINLEKDINFWSGVRTIFIILIASVNFILIVFEVRLFIRRREDYPMYK